MSETTDMLLGKLPQTLVRLVWHAGLGHLLGLDTHDIGGYLPHTPERPSAPGLKSLRTARQAFTTPCTQYREMLA